MLTSAFTWNKYNMDDTNYQPFECLEKTSNRIPLANAEPEMLWMDSPSHTPRNEAGTGIYLHVAPSDPLHLAVCVPSGASSPSLTLWRLSTHLKESDDNSWESGSVLEQLSVGIRWARTQQSQSTQTCRSQSSPCRERAHLAQDTIAGNQKWVFCLPARTTSYIWALDQAPDTERHTKELRQP